MKLKLRMSLFYKPFPYLNAFPFSETIYWDVITT